MGAMLGPLQPKDNINCDCSSFDFEAMMEDLRSSPQNTVVILHAAAHNPTGDNLLI
jgi:aspartate/tyrosine/aromatic aminotransferase